MIAILTHPNADLDALASQVAASRLYPESVIIAPSQLSPAVSRFLALHRDHFQIRELKEVDANTIQKIVIVDVRDERRLTEFSSFLSCASCPVEVWDHHPKGPQDIKADLEVIEPLGACVTLLLEALWQKGVEFDDVDATLFMLGIYADTGRLSYRRTHPRDVLAAARLLEAHQANLKIVNRYLRHQHSPEQDALFRTLFTSVTACDWRGREVAFVEATVNRGVRGTSLLVEQVFEMGGHDAIFALIDQGSRIQLIGRSHFSGLNVGAIMKRFGGGGHPSAGAASRQNVGLAQARAELEEALAECPYEPRRVRSIMKSPVLTLTHDMSLQAAQDFLHQHGIKGAPVMRDGVVAGMLSLRDVWRAASQDRLDLPVSSHMSHDLFFVEPNDTIEESLRTTARKNIGRLPVMGENSELLGILTRTDLIGELYMKVRDDSDLGQMS